MKLFRTTVSISPSKRPALLKTSFFTVGSCFADAIGARLKKYKFNTCINPFGVVYNPISIHNLLQKSVVNGTVFEDTFIQQEDLFFNFDFHSRFSSTNKNSLRKEIESTVSLAHQTISSVDFVILTYGTAWVYERNDTKAIVANCHKVPQKHFSKRLLQQKELLASFEECYTMLKKINPRVHIILTVSPVRHIKDSIELNSVSKSILRTSCHTITTQYQDVEYFPAFEIMIDELRDYRFYKADMLHPTEEAEEYIWEKFCEKYFDEQTRHFIAEWSAILSALQHKPFHTESAAHQRFLKNLKTKVENMAALVDVQEEIRFIDAQIADSSKI